VDTVRLGFLLRPGWVAVTAAVVLFAIVCFTLLGPWQFRRHEEKKAVNDAVRASFEVPPRPIDTIPPDGREWQQVTLTGSYLAESEVVVRLRTVQGEPAFEVVTPFRLTGGETVLVDRGFVRPATGGAGNRGNAVPDYAAPPTGELTVIGRLRRDEGDGRPPVLDGGRRQVYSINAGVIGAATGLELRPGYVQLNADQPGVLGPLPLPRLDAGPHLAYALQWLAFGATALVGWVLLVRRELAERAATTAEAGSGHS
jgi:cytochrome oxidase assembly protein ShyY1